MKGFTRFRKDLKALSFQRLGASFALWVFKFARFKRIHPGFQWVFEAGALKAARPGL